MSRLPASPNVVLTGACGGLGRALASAWLARGARLALVGLQREVLEAMAAGAPDRCAVYTPDVSDSAAMQVMARDWSDHFGTPDVVIANAGVGAGYLTEEAADLAVMRRILEINLIGAAASFQPFIAAMRQRGSGTLVGIASLAGRRGLPGNGAYCASKAGLIRLLESLRAEERASGLTVLTVTPGYLRTALTAGNQFAMPHMLEPEVAAEAIVRAIERGDTQLDLPRRTAWLMRAIALLPGAWQDRVFAGQPRKPRAGEAGASAIPGLPSNDR